MYTDEQWKMIAAEERAERLMSPDYSPAVARRTHLHPSDPGYLPAYEEEECPDCGGTGVHCHYADNGDKISAATYESRMRMTPAMRELAGGANVEPCETCGGTGLIEVPIEYDRQGRRLN